ncbi:lactosylceramide 4-alpha-galactosyltransferase-like [Anopheles ziemanni]|uniref:lactosylceramide 4-alpha-galactosyltransferase-like n=1 Tax=Anopheles coustani TaxID=139045 RepID=UPI0026581032|nr:lactosylceramide 4-alpha-galactosyltransferase-like [Anopheles coustani]XP_058177524.1 lactosylceramide 4-alpha-galactosyltransferase-like [Anopheles ziemanni]
MFSSRLSYYLRLAALALAIVLFFRTLFKGHDKAPTLTDEPISSYKFLEPFTDGDELLKYRNVYFIESSAPFRNVVTIEPRHACAIEAAARANPRKNIIVLLAAWIDFTEADRLQIPDLSRLAGFRNVHFRWLDLENFALDTPVDSVIKSDELYSLPDGVAFLSEILRMVLLYKYGGIYLDLDVMTLAPLDLYHPNFFSAQSMTSADTSVMGLERGDYGQQFAMEYLEDIKYFHEIGETRNGSTLLTNKLLQVCEKVTVHEIVENGCFSLLDVHRQHAFHPFDASNINVMFDSALLDEAKQMLANSMAVHMLHHHSRTLQSDSNGETGYEMVAKTYCPNVYYANEGEF